MVMIGLTGKIMLYGGKIFDPVNGTDCCCGCVCACGKLRDLGTASDLLELTITGIATTPSSPLTMINGFHVDYPDCLGWKVDFADSSCDLGNLTAWVICMETEVLFLIEEGAPGGCQLIDLAQVSLTCNDTTFAGKWQGEIAPHPDGPDPPTCTAPCDGTTVTFDVVPL